jgi:NAD(P)H dehydrogenase (quinone)
VHVLIVHAHPEPRSFNGALTARGRKVLEEAGHRVVVSDLYAMGWNPVSDRRNFSTVADPAYFKQQAEETLASERGGFAPDVEAEIRKVEACDALVLQFPLWWFGLPAILKGWVDRVFAMGRVYGGGKWYDRGAFRGKRGMLSVTTGGPPSMYGPDGLNGDLGQILFPVNHGILRFTGFDVLPPFVAWGPARATAEQREAWLGEYGRRLLAIPSTDPVAYPSLDEYGPDFRRKPR